MKAFARIILVNGIERHFTGDCLVNNLKTFVREKDAVEYGSNWAKEKNIAYKEAGLNVHASYELKTLELI